jgi:molybdopterin-synthase adenylyltransferase
MSIVSSPTEPDVFHDDRFARHRLIEGFSQELVASLKLAVIGAGAIGNELVKNLLLVGVGAIDLYDFDKVERSNLTRSLFLRESDIGLNKAQAVIARAQELYPASALRAFPGAIARKLSLAQMADYDVVIAAVDNLEARLRINEMALLSKSNWINLAIDARSAVVDVFPMGSASTACYACSLPHTAFERLAARYSCGGLQRAAWLERKVPTTTITASSAAALGCSELLRLVHQQALEGKRPQLQGTVAHTLFGGYPSDQAQRVYFDTIAPAVSRSTLRRAGPDRGCPGCGLHQRPGIIVRTASLDSLSRKIEEIRSSHPDPLALELRLSDALIIDCHCLQCGADRFNCSALADLHGARAKERTDVVTRCPQCQSDTVTFDIVEQVPLDQFEKTFNQRLPDCSWIQIGEFCFDLHDLHENTPTQKPEA